MKKLLILIIIIFITGCDSYIELNDLAIINTIGLEKENNNYKLYASVVDITEKESLDIPTTSYQVTGTSLNQIIDNLSMSLNKKIYMSHLNLLIINDSIKTKELEEIINFFLNNNETREDFLVVNCNNIKDIIKKMKFQEINDLIENNSRNASETIKTTMYDVIKNFYDKKNIYLPSIILDSSISLDGIKEFKNNKYKEIKGEDIIYLNYFLNKIDTYKYSYTCDDNKYLYLNILESNTSFLTKELLITNEIKVITNDCNYNKDKIENIFNTNLKTNLEKLTNKKITIKNTIRGTYEN